MKVCISMNCVEWRLQVPSLFGVMEMVSFTSETGYLIECNRSNMIKIQIQLYKCRFLNINFKCLFCNVKERDLSK